MPPEDVLLMMAQLGVAIAGFNGVATALGHGARTGPRREVIGSVLITSAAAVIVWSVVPLVLLTAPVAPAVVWRFSSLGWCGVQLGLVVFRERQGRRLQLAATPLVRTMQGFVLMTAALQLWNGIALGEAWPHVVAVAQSLGVSITAFFMLSHERDSAES